MRRVNWTRTEGAMTKLVVRSIDARVRPANLRLPFRFGANTLTACPQLFVRVEIDAAIDGTEGYAAELMVPKWFDKRASLSPAQNIEHLARAVKLAAEAYANDAPATSYELHARHRDALARAGMAEGLTELSASYGQAVLDRVDDLPGWNWSAWLASLQPLRRIEARHTVGLLDELDAARDGEDGLPVS